MREGAGVAVPAAGVGQGFQVVQHTLEIVGLGAVDAGVAVRRAGVDRGLDPRHMRQGLLDEGWRQHRGVGGHGRVDAGLGGGGHHAVDVLVQHGFAFAGEHDAAYAQPSHVGQGAFGGFQRQAGRW